mmetsp:Transcript_42286/g.85047  ORF Transcript_42286/g.85047 Transcript_42286/m.85047 type:complete len:285 (-) Transcript_42286:374-1228(-)
MMWRRFQLFPKASWRSSVAVFPNSMGAALRMLKRHKTSTNLLCGMTTRRRTAIKRAILSPCQTVTAAPNRRWLPTSQAGSARRNSHSQPSILYPPRATWLLSAPSSRACHRAAQTTLDRVWWWQVVWQTLLASRALYQLRSIRKRTRPAKWTLVPQCRKPMVQPMLARPAALLRPQKRASQFQWQRLLRMKTRLSQVSQGRPPPLQKRTPSNQQWRRKRRLRRHARSWSRTNRSQRHSPKASSVEEGLNGAPQPTPQPPPSICRPTSGRGRTWWSARGATRCAG